MFEFENSITIDRPLEHVFAFATDLTRIPLWNYYVQTVRLTSERPRSEGATYHQVRKNDEQALRIVRLVPNELFVVETVPPSKPELRREMSFAGSSGGTFLRDRWQLDLGVPKLLERLAGSRARNGVRENLGKLKTLLEEGQVTLQDGRVMTL